MDKNGSIPRYITCSSCDLPDYVPPDPPDLLPFMCGFLSSAAPATLLSSCSVNVLGLVMFSSESFDDSFIAVCVEPQKF